MANYQYQVQMQNRATAEQAQQRQFEVTSSEAEDAAKMAYLLNAKRSREFEQQAANEITAVARQSQKAAGTARVSAAEMGAAGLSVEALLKDFTRQEMGYQTAVLREQENRAYMSNVERTSIQQQQLARITGAMPQPLPVIGAPVLPPRPTFLAAGLQMGDVVTRMFGNEYVATALTI
jgi:Fe-S cluster assembly iron-binding protein IscA